MTKHRLFLSVALVATALSCEHARPLPHDTDNVYCSQKLLITEDSG